MASIGGGQGTEGKKTGKDDRFPRSWPFQSERACREDGRAQGEKKKGRRQLGESMFEELEVPGWLGRNGMGRLLVNQRTVRASLIPVETRVGGSKGGI